jgi:hypothetical protein
MRIFVGSLDDSNAYGRQRMGKISNSSECIQKVSKTRGLRSRVHGCLLLNGTHSMKINQ